uniref:helix-turn-helix domain-containing protein n=1 Tax=Sciscionella sediminilitoris TaxID=1445613 RepID=UPI0004DF59D9
LCLHLVRLDHGASVANAIARRLVVPPHRDGGQAQFITTPMAGDPGDVVLGELFEWVYAHLDEPLTIADLARRANLSPRTLARRFRAVTGLAPLQWLLTQRVHRAQELLETTEHGIEQIAAKTGMGTATTLRRHFNRVVGTAPDAYRRTFLREAGSTHTRVSTASTATAMSSTLGEAS